MLRAAAMAVRRRAQQAAALAGVMIALPHVGAISDDLATGSAGTIARWMPILLLLALVGAIAVAALHRRAGIVAIILVSAFDMVSFAYLSPWHGGASVSPREGAHALRPRSHRCSDRHTTLRGGVDRWASDSYIWRSTSLSKDLLGINGYDPLLQKEWAETAGAWVYDGFPTTPIFGSPVAQHVM